MRRVLTLSDAVAGGGYARKQILSRSRLISWSHTRRFQTAVSLAGAFAGKRVLDYGSGDGTFLAMLMMRPTAPALAVGAELPRDVIEDCRVRFANEPRVRFLHVHDLDLGEHTAAYDAVFCMEVLEHVCDWDPLLARVSRLLAPGGRLVVSVPVETGLPVVVKQLVRHVAGWRRIGDYPGTSSYSWAQLAAAVFAGNQQHVTRPVFYGGSGPFHDHKGFNWMVLRDRLSRQFEIERTMASPFQVLGPHLAAQVWMVARVSVVSRRRNATTPRTAGERI